MGRQSPKKKTPSRQAFVVVCVDACAGDQAKRLAGGVLFAQLRLREKTMREHGHMARPGTHMFRANRTS
jgi:hypothetical protein